MLMRGLADPADPGFHDVNSTLTALRAAGTPRIDSPFLGPRIDSSSRIELINWIN